ncbi:MAG: GNAT family N-acetyltransferase [Dactylosporangium sp.]|nr:GNAT family N-acetyltransferase [Dactylosporangium sp.]NNJ60949.1 GNAT family N-acetyltransferase [Dactylosporangium sp.]
MTIHVRPIRRRSPAEVDTVRTLLAEAFAPQRVDSLVDLLRSSPGHIPELDFVAVDDDEIVGHLMLNRVFLRQPDGATRDVLCLAPLAVRPDRRGEGTGRALVEHAVRVADQRGEPCIVVEGDQALYRGFGFVDATDHGLLLPSPTIPAGSYQVMTLSSHDASLRGRIDYPARFWAADGRGVPEPVEETGPYRIPWLFAFTRYAGWLEAATVSADGDRAVPGCPGWTVADVLTHLGMIHRRVITWIGEGRRPTNPLAMPAGQQPHAWYAEGWRMLYDVLAATPRDAPAATWSAWDNTNGFWRRRMTHEIAVHALDVFSALGTDPGWTVSDDVALDGIDEVLRLFLGSRLGSLAGGLGGMVSIEAGARRWEVGLNRSVEVHSLPTPPRTDALVTGDPAAVYAWLWNRRAPAPAGTVTVGGDQAVVADLQRCLVLATT